jgi:hypothetical protein
VPISRPNPPGSASFRLGDHVGDLLLIVPGTYHEAVATRNGVKPALDVEVVVLTDGQGPPADPPTRVKARIFGAVVIQQLLGREGEFVLGRLELGEAKAGRSAPYILKDPTELDEAIADEYLESIADN